ncbi:MAG: quinate 5-dehydrogenase, partial [Armatimonadetes bacterium]|nr:quinate 5-dehydrogenase [Armatimonadota bacterium]
MSAERPLHVVSISLGSDQRDKTVEVELLGRTVRLERRGTNGDLKRAAALVAELDGKVDAFGLGGTDLYLVAGKKRYVIRDAVAICRAAKQTPILDGSGLKHTLEREALRRLDESGQLPIRDRKVLMVCSVDRFGMAEAIWGLTHDVAFGDLMFGLGLPLLLTSLGQLRGLARLLLPVLVRLPFKFLYPTGEKQSEI